MKNLIKKLKIKKELLFLILLLILGAFLRFYRLQALMTYLGDEGRDMLIVMNLLRGKNLPFVGPPTSVGKLYLGPIYYYFITPFAWLFKMNPVGPAVFVALLGVLTIPLVYLTGKVFFNRKTGLLASAFYTISPLIIKFSRSSWNPNPMPFFSLALLLSLFSWQKTKKSKFFYLAVACFGIMLQLHYLAILLTPFLIFVILKFGKNAAKKKSFIYGFLLFIFLLSPLIFFDLKHNFFNLKGILAILSDRSKEGFSLFDFFSRAKDRLRQLFSLFFHFTERSWQTNLTIIIVCIVSVLDWFKQKRITKLLIYSLFVWSILSFALYRHSIYPHYLGFLFPFPALLTANTFDKIFNKNRLMSGLKTALFLAIVLYMLQLDWRELTRPQVLNVNLVRKISNQIAKESKGEPFNFALLAENNYDDSYRFFFHLMNLPVFYETKVTKQLFVVCEGENACLIRDNPKWEIAMFANAYHHQIKVVKEWSPDPFIKVFKFKPK